MIHRTHIFYLGFQLDVVSHLDVLLVTQCSIERLQSIEELSNHWLGPISIALYLNDAEVPYFMNYLKSSTKLSGRKNIAYHIIYKEGVLMIWYLLFKTIYKFKPCAVHYSKSVL